MSTESIVCADLRTWLINHGPHELRTILPKACASRGRRKGRLLASDPGRGDEHKRAAWLALMGWVAPVRVGVWSILSLGDEARATHDAIDEWLRREPIARWVVRMAAGRPWEFHLDHMSYDKEKARELAKNQDICPDFAGFY